MGFAAFNESFSVDSLQFNHMSMLHNSSVMNKLPLNWTELNHHWTDSLNNDNVVFCTDVYNWIEFVSQLMNFATLRESVHCWFNSVITCWCCKMSVRKESEHQNWICFIIAEFYNINTLINWTEFNTKLTQAE